MNIGMILDGVFPPDIRVEKEAKSLANAGHNVYVLSVMNRSFPQVEEKFNGYIIYRFNTKNYPFLRNISRDFKKIRFYDPVWKKGIEEFIKRYNIKALHVHDLPMVKTAFVVGLKYHIPVVADYHENFPAHEQSVHNETKSYKVKYYRSYKRWAKYEENISHKVYHIIVVADEYKNHLIEMHSIPAEKISVVQNTLNIEKITKSTFIKNKYKSNFIISYFGGFGPHRGLDVVVTAMKSIIKIIPAAKLLLVGKGKSEKELRQLSNNLSLSESIEFVGWKKYEDLQQDFINSDIGIIPHHASEHTDNTIPNKIFEYMYFKVPLLVSNRPPLQRIINETKAGLSFKAGSSEDLAKKVIEIYDNPENYGENGHKAVINKYNWKNDAQNLIKIYDQLSRNRK